jgi:hypothetical protein
VGVREILVRRATRVVRRVAQRCQKGLIGGTTKSATFHQPIYPPHTDKPNGVATAARTPMRIAFPAQLCPVPLVSDDRLSPLPS